MNTREVKDLLRTKAQVEVETLQDGGESAIGVDAASLVSAAEALRTLPGLELGWLETILCTRIKVKQAAHWKLTYIVRSVAHERTLIGAELPLVVVVPESSELVVRVPSVAKVWPMAKAMERDVSVWSGMEFL